MDNSIAALREVLEGREDAQAFLRAATYYQLGPRGKLHASEHCSSLKSWQPRPDPLQLGHVPTRSELCSFCGDQVPGGGAAEVLEELGRVLLLEEHLDGSRRFYTTLEEHGAGVLRLLEDEAGEWSPELATRGQRAREALEARMEELASLHRGQQTISLSCALEVRLREIYGHPDPAPWSSGMERFTALEAWKQVVLASGSRGSLDRAIEAAGPATERALRLGAEVIESCTEEIITLVESPEVVLVWRHHPGGWCAPAEEALVAASLGEIHREGALHVSRTSRASGLWLELSANERGGSIEAAVVTDAVAAEILTRASLPRGWAEVSEGLLAGRDAELSEAVSLGVLSTAYSYVRV